MKTEKYILSHNLGTTGNMAALYGENGDLIRSWFCVYPTKYSHGNRVEQNSDDWWKAICESTRNILRGMNEKSIAAVSFSGQMMGCLCLDRTGAPLGNAIIWADMRAVAESNKLHQDIDEAEFYKITGHRISAAYSLSKLLWIKNNAPDIYKKTDKIVQAKDYIVYKLTGKIVTDYTDASGTNMFDLSSSKWSQTILSIAGIREDILPELLPSTAIAGHVTLEAAVETGLLPGTPVVAGAGDGLCAAIAAGCIRPDDVYLYFGSSSWIGLAASAPFIDPAMRTFNWAHVVPGLYSPCGTMQAAGASISWMSSQLAHSEIDQAEKQHCSLHQIIDREIKKSIPGANGLLFLPYLMGERSPHWNPSAKGVLLGIKMENTREDIFRAYVEGVVLNLRLIWDSMKEIISGEELVIIGALASSDIKKQIIADILGIPVVEKNHSRDSKSFGAAMIGGMGIGMYKDLNTVKKLLKNTTRTEPDLKNRDYYNKILPVFSQSYLDLRKTFSMLDNF